MEDEPFERFLCLLQKLSEVTTNLCKPEERSPNELLKLSTESSELLHELSSLDIHSTDRASGDTADGTDRVTHSELLRQSLVDLMKRTDACKTILEAATERTAAGLKSLREIQKARRAYKSMA